MKKFALAGNPNSGKTTLFNALTGSTAHVGNWPGVTVDKREGVYRGCAEPISIVDLPGIYSLSPYTPEEVISRNFILDEKPDCVINIVDATNLERNLYLTTQVMEIDVPVVIALNMMDVVEKNGDAIDVGRLEERIGLPVVGISALRETDIDVLMDRAFEVSKKPREGQTVLQDTSLMHLIGDCKIALEGQGVDNALFHAIKLVELDELEVAAHPSSTTMVEEFKKTFTDDTFGSDFEAIVADSRYKYISKNYSSVLTRKKTPKTEKEKLTRSDRIDKVLTNKWAGIPIFLVVLFLVFHLTFSEDFLYLGAGGAFNKPPALRDAGDHVVQVTEDTYDESADYFDKHGNLVEPVFENGALVAAEAVPVVYDKSGKRYRLEEAAEHPDGQYYSDKRGKRKVSVEGSAEDGYEIAFDSSIDEYLDGIDAEYIFGGKEAINGPGYILFYALDALMGLISVSVDEGLTLAGAPGWINGFLVDGVLGGLFAVLSYLPQILMLFLFFSIMEDTGYMARVAFILDRIFRRFGLSGRSFMPMIMGFGCSVPATINTRTLADDNERTATVRVIPFFSCSAKLPILTAVAGGIIGMAGIGNADIITYSMYVLGVVTAIAAVIFMRSTTLKGEAPPFIMELPAYRVPGFKNLMRHLWDKVKHFVKKAFTLILASTIVIWFIGHFSFYWEFLPDERMAESILAGLGGIITPLFTPLGFGSQLKAFQWVFVVAAITGLVAKENVIATFGTLAAAVSGSIVSVEADAGISAVGQMIAATGITIPALLSFIAYNMTTIPCFAAVAVARSELKDEKKFRHTLVFWLVVSYIVSLMIYVIGSWCWTAFIFAAAWAVVIALIVLTNKGVIDWKKIGGTIREKIMPRSRGKEELK